MTDPAYREERYWVVAGDFRVGPCTNASAAQWMEYLKEQGGTPKRESYEENP